MSFKKLAPWPRRSPRSRFRPRRSRVRAARGPSSSRRGPPPT